MLDSYRDYLQLLARLRLPTSIAARLDESDLVQETLLKVVSRVDQFRGTTEAEFTAWLRNILSSTVADAVRKHGCAQRRSVGLERKLAEHYSQSSTALGNFLDARTESPSKMLMRRERSVILADAIAGLTPLQREVIVLHGLQQIPVGGVATMLDQSEASVWKLWARGLQALRTRLDSDED